MGIAVDVSTVAVTKLSTWNPTPEPTAPPSPHPTRQPQVIVAPVQPAKGGDASAASSNFIYVGAGIGGGVLLLVAAFLINRCRHSEDDEKRSP